MDLLSVGALNISTATDTRAHRHRLHITNSTITTPRIQDVYHKRYLRHCTSSFHGLSGSLAYHQWQHKHRHAIPVRCSSLDKLSTSLVDTRCNTDTVSVGLANVVAKLSRIDTRYTCSIYASSHIDSLISTSCLLIMDVSTSRFLVSFVSAILKPIHCLHYSNQFGWCDHWHACCGHISTIGGPQSYRLLGLR